LADVMEAGQKGLPLTSAVLTLEVAGGGETWPVKATFSGNFNS
jgi:hypothetical protein